MRIQIELFGLELYMGPPRDDATDALLLVISMLLDDWDDDDGGGGERVPAPVLKLLQRHQAG